MGEALSEVLAGFEGCAEISWEAQGVKSDDEDGTNGLFQLKVAPMSLVYMGVAPCFLASSHIQCHIFFAHDPFCPIRAVVMTRVSA